MSKNSLTGNSLAVQWVGLCTPPAEGLGSSPGQGTKSHKPQVKDKKQKTKNKKQTHKKNCIKRIYFNERIVL